MRFDSLGYLIGASILLYLARLMARRRARQPGESLVFALVVATACFHVGRFVERVSTSLSGASLSILATSAAIVAFGALALLPPLLLHTHLILAIEGLAGSASPRLAAIQNRLRRWRIALLAITYAPLVLLPIALVRVATALDLDPLVRLSGFERPFVIWIVWALAVSTMADLALARNSRSHEEGRLFFAVGLTFTVNAALFVVTFLLGARRISGLGEALVAICLLSSIAPACVFAYFIYRYNALGLIVRRGAVAAVVAGLTLFGYVFALRQVSIWIESLYGLDPRITDAALLVAIMLVLAPFAGRIREGVFRTVFPDLARQRALARELGASLYRFGTRSELASHVANALKTASRFETAGLILSDGQDPLFRLIPIGATAIVRAEVADDRLAAAMDERRAVSLVPVWQPGTGQLAALVAVGHSPDWPLMSAGDAAPLVRLAIEIANALEHVAVIEANVSLERRLQLEKHLATIGRLAATVAHEVKNPLGAIKTIVQVMQEQGTDDAGARDLEMIVSEIDRLAATVNQLLAFARMQDRDAEAAPGPFTTLRAGPSNQVGGSPTAALAKAADLFRAEAARRSVNLDVSVDRRLEAARVGVPGLTTEQVFEILSNLILNALQAESRHVALWATIQDAHDHLRVRIVNEDDGHGIPGTQQSSVFEPFFTTRQRGTGLGLAIVAQRVRMAGGTVTLESPITGDGRGTRFIVELPAFRDAADVPLGDRERVEQS